MQNRKRIRVGRLEFTEEELQRARDKAEEEFRELNKPIIKKKKKRKK